MTLPATPDPAYPERTIIRLKDYRTRRKYTPLLVTISQAAELLSISERSMYRLLDKKGTGIREARLGGMRRIEYQSLVEYVESKSA